ncbi:extracellular solute-binding protein [Streptomyces heilongjiangensis]|nr:extracellular solute-binding protein [Streptomyces heilongjiangensis]MDC2951453.1 extracellular solute-binding protein [Streptomyces heilongjiangensis]
MKTAGAKEGQWRVAFPPGGAGSKGGSYMSVLSSRKHQKEAYQIVKWMMSPANQASGFKSNGLFPSALEACTSPEVTAGHPSYGGQATGTAFAKVAEEPPTHSRHPAERHRRGRSHGASKSVGQGKASPAGARKSAQAQIAEQLKRCRR